MATHSTTTPVGVSHTAESRMLVHATYGASVSRLATGSSSVHVALPGSMLTPT